MKVLCMGDSLCLPREGCYYEETWYSLLKQAYPSVDMSSFFFGGAHVNEIKKEWEGYYQFIKPDMVILQVGICDSAPRYFNEHKLIWRIVLLICNFTHTTNFFWRIIKKGSRKPDVVDTPLPLFKKQYEQLVNEMKESGVKKIIVIKIGHGDKRIEAKSPYFNSNADKYNNIIEEIVKQKPTIMMCIDP